MLNRRILTLGFLLSLGLFITSVNGHIPVVPDGGTTLETATEIVNPEYSWFYYTTLESGDVHYYKFEATQDERIRFMLNLPIPEGDRGFNPSLVLMGPGIIDGGVIPGSIELPVGAGIRLFEPEGLEPEYEGFTPMSQYKTIDLNMSAPQTGTYYIAIYDETYSGRYALVSGYIEAYSILEWISIPFMVVTLLQWSGQNILLILLPSLIPLIIGLPILYKRESYDITTNSVVPIIGGLLFLGSGLSTLVQMVYALLQAPANWTVILTPIFASLPFILGLSVLYIIRENRWIQNRRNGVKLIIVGILAPFVWAGFLLGPILVILAGLTPFWVKIDDS